MKQKIAQVNNGRFEKGLIPWNKGKKFPKEAHWNYQGVNYICIDCGNKVSTKKTKRCLDCYKPFSSKNIRLAQQKAVFLLKNKVKQLGFYHSKESRKKMSLLRINNKRYSIIKDTKIERIIEGLLIKHHIHFEKQKPLCNVTITDFYLPEYRIAVFCDGCYWHGCKEHRSIDRAVELNKRQNLVLIQNGYNVVRLWEHDILRDSEECIHRIINLINFKHK